MTKRWIDEGAPEEIRDLLRDATPPRAMLPSERARSAARLFGPAGALRPANPVAAPTASPSMGWLKVGATTVALALGVGATNIPAGPTVDGTGRMGAPGPRSASVTTRTSASARHADLSRMGPPSGDPPSATERLPAVGPPRAMHPPASAPATLAEEAAWLERARAALGTTPALALKLANEHATRFPKGQLQPERDLIAIDALMRLGQPRAAEVRAAALLARPGVYRDRAERLLAHR